MDNGMWNSPATERRIEEVVAGAEEDRLALLKWWLDGVEMFSNMHEKRITLCDAGCGIDLEGIIRDLTPHDDAAVEKHAREVAADWEEV